MDRARTWLLVLLAVTAAAAAEPVGVVEVERRWLDPLPAELQGRVAGDERALVLELVPLRSITAATVTLELPAEVMLRDLDPAEGVAVDPEPQARQRISLAPLAAQARRTLRFAVRDESVRAGTIIVVTIEGRLESGEPFREVVGVPVGRAGADPPERSGAIEFPAAREPGPER